MGRDVGREVKRMAEQCEKLCESGAAPEEVCEKLLAARTELTRLGARSGWLQWQLAIGFDASGAPEKALPEILVAIALDPLVPPFRHSHRVIVGHLREKLLAAEPVAQGALYEVLLQAGEANETCHLAMARTFAAIGQEDRARRVLEALTVLSPGCVEAWVALAALHGAQGRAAEAREAGLQAAMLCGAVVSHLGVAQPALA